MPMAPIQYKKRIEANTWSTPGQNTKGVGVWWVLTIAYPMMAIRGRADSHSTT